MKFVIVFIVALLCSILWIWATIVEPYLKIDYDNITINTPSPLNKIDGLKIAIISDIHFGNAPLEVWRLNNIIRTTNKANADIILILGDYVNAATPYGQINLDILTHNLKKLKAPLGVYSSMGNHDSYYGHNVVKKAIADAGIKIIENSNVKVNTRYGDLYLAGVADAFSQNYYLLPTFKDIPQDAPTILLSHSPDVFREMPNPAKLMLSGHTHGGQIKLPKIGAILVNLMIEKIAEGKLQRGDKTLYVTRGLGTSRITARFLCPPAITIATISK